MRRGQVWTASRAGHDNLVVIVSYDALIDACNRVLTVPISDVRPASLVEPSVTLVGGDSLGVAMAPRVGQTTKTSLTEARGELDPASIEALDIALRAALNL